MKEIQFKTRTLSIVSSETRLNSDYDDGIFPELCILFDQKDTDISCSYFTTHSGCSD